MGFKRTSIDIELLNKKEKITLEDFLNIFIDLCFDVNEDTGEAASMLPISDMESASDCLEICATLITMIGDGHPELFDVHVKNPLQEALEEIENQKGQFSQAKLKKEQTLLDKIDYYQELINYLENEINKLQTKHDEVNGDLEQLIVDEMQL